MQFRFEVSGSTVVIHDFSFTNQLLANYLNSLGEAEREGYLKEAMEFGLNTLVTISSQAEIREMESAVKSAKTALIDTRDDLVLRLKQAFDEQVDSKSASSLISVFQERVSTYLKTDLSPTNQDSPLYQIKLDLENIVAQLEGAKAQKQILAKTPIKGNEFELVVNSLLSEIGTIHGDSVEFVGADGGGSAQSGDTLVTFSGSYSKSSGSFRAIWESKTDKSFKSQKGILKQSMVSQELDKAIKVRGADCAVFVADSAGLGNQPEWQEFRDNKLIVVLDMENPDPHILRLAYLWTKTVAARMAVKSDSVDVGQLEAILADFRAKMATFTVLRAAHTDIESGLKNSRAWVEREAEGFAEIFERLEAAVMPEDLE